MKENERLRGKYSKRMMKSIKAKSRGIVPLTLLEKLLLAGEGYLLIYLMNQVMNFDFHLAPILVTLAVLLVAYAGHKALEAKSSQMERAMEKEYLLKIAERMIDTEKGDEERKKAAPLIRTLLNASGPAVEHYRIWSSIAERSIRLILALVTIFLMLSVRDLIKLFPFMLGSVFAALLVSEFETRLDERYRHRYPKDAGDVKTYSEEVLPQEIKDRSKYTDLKCLLDIFKTFISLAFTLSYVFIFPPNLKANSLVLVYALYEFFLITVKSGINGRDAGICNEDARLYFEFTEGKTGDEVDS